MSYQPETPFDNIESALEYVTHLLEATEEAHKQIETEIERTGDLELARRKQALQLVSYKLATARVAHRREPPYSEGFEDPAPFAAGRTRSPEDLLNPIKRERLRVPERA